MSNPELNYILKALGQIHAPVILLQLVTMIWMNTGGIKSDLDMIEYFAGQQAAAWLPKLLAKPFYHKRWAEVYWGCLKIGVPIWAPQICFFSSKNNCSGAPILRHSH